MSKAELIKKAESLGINTEGLTVAQLQGAIANAEDSHLKEKEVVDAHSPKIGDQSAPEEEETEEEETEEEETEEEESEEEEETEEEETEEEESEEEEETEEEETEEEESEEEEAPEPGVFRYNGTDYAFKKSAPERFNFLNQNKSQEEWLQDETAMELLIEGNSSYIKSLKN